MLSYIESLNYPTSCGKMEEYDFRKRWHEIIYMVNKQNKMSYRQVIFLTLFYQGGFQDLSYRSQKSSVHNFCDETGQFYTSSNWQIVSK